MAAPQPHNSRTAHALDADWLAFVRDLGGRLSAAVDPLAVLDRAMAKTGELIGADACRLIRGTGGVGRESGWNLRAIVCDRDGDHAAIEAAVSQPDAEALDRAAAFLDVLATLAGLALAKSSLDRHRKIEHGVGGELDSAVRLQRSLQPESTPDEMPIWGFNLPARELSGDFFDFFRLGDDRIAFSLGDVSGKGVNAALLMAKTVSLFRCLGKRIGSPAALLAAVNEELCETSVHGMFVTMVAGHYLPHSGRVAIANAGHQPPLLRRQDRSYRTFPATAPPLGIVAGIAIDDEEIELDGGEFYVFTDGLTEYRHGDGEELGVEGLIQLIEAFGKESPARRINLVLETLDSEEGWAVRDDLTVLAIDDAWVRRAGFEEADR